MNHDIFISYTQPNRKEAFTIHDMLQANGFKSWIATSKDYGIPAGDYFEGTIVSAISACKIFLLIYSNYSNISEHVIIELRHKKKGQKVIIIRLDNSDYNDDLSWYLKGLQYLDGRGSNWSNTLTRLLDQVNKDLIAFKPVKYKSTDQFLLSNGIQLLENKMYPEAEQRLREYISIEPGDSIARFSLVLSIMRGRKSRKLDGIEVKNIENILSPVLHNKKNGYIRLLLAIIKYGYYISNGLRETEPSAGQLLTDLEIEKEKAEIILTHLNDPENSVWVQLENSYYS